MQNSSGLKRSVATQPSRTRYRVAGLLLLLAGVTYLDRACISILAPQISADLGLTKVQMSFVFSAFAMAYAAFEVPTAWWGERIGARRILTRIVVWWSCLQGAFLNPASRLLGRITASVHRKSEASHVEWTLNSKLTRIFDNEV